MSAAAATSGYTSTVETFVDSTLVHIASPELKVTLSTRGATITSLKLRTPTATDPNDFTELVLGFNDPAEYLTDTAYIGTTCGRFAGRIENGKFDIDGVTYTLETNEGHNTLHGGPNGFDKQEWKYLLVEGENEIGVSFHLISPHLDQGFPGEVFTTATYTISKQFPAQLDYTYQAVLADSSPVDNTVINLTNHTYWNLNGVARGANDATWPLPETVHNHIFHAHSKYRAVAEESILTGEVVSVEGTSFDYSRPRVLGEGITASETLGRDPAGFDDTCVLDEWDGSMREAAILKSPSSHIQMTLSTTAPAVVVYTSNFLPADADGSKGRRFQRHSAVCLETQYFPNSPNLPEFPSTTLRKGEHFEVKSRCSFQVLHAK